MEKTIKHVVFVVESYGSFANANGICVKRIVDYIKNNNIKIEVVTSRTNKQQRDHEIINGIDVYYFDKNIENKLRLRNYKNKYLNKLLANILPSIIHRVWEKISIIFGFYPSLSFSLPKRYLNMIEQINNSNKIDCIFAAYTGIDEVKAAELFLLSHNDTKSFLYTLDAFSARNAALLFNSEKRAKKIIKRLELEAFNIFDYLCLLKAHEVFYSTDEYKSFADKIYYVDIPLLHNACNIVKQKLCNEEFLYNVVYTGAMALKTGNPSYAFELFDGLQNVSLQLYGTSHRKINKLFNQKNFKNIFLRGRVEHLQIHEIQQEADFLLNIGCDNPNMITCKLFEYMSTGKPIIHIYNINNDASLKYLEKYPDVLLINMNDSLRDNRNKLLAFISAEHQLIEWNYLKKIFWENTPYPIAQLIKR